MKRGVSEIRGALLLRALEATDITVFYQNLDLQYVWIENPPFGWKEQDIVGKDDFQILPEQAASEVSKAKRQAISSGQNGRIELEVKTLHGPRWFDVWIDPDNDASGTVIGVLCFSVEVTDRKKKEGSLHQLLLEVSHRSRNLLAIVEGLARQSLHEGKNSATLERFNQRIQSLAITLDVVTADNWDGATLQELISKQVRPYVTGGGGIVFTGDDPQLTPNAAVHIGLAIQELVASKQLDHSESCESSSITVDASMVEQDDGRCLKINWRTPCESAQHLSIDKMRTTTLNRVVPQALSGKADLKVEDGVTFYTLLVPSQNFA